MFRVLGYNYDTIAYQLTFKEQYTKTEIRYPNKFANKVVVYNTLTNTIIPEYKAIDTVTRYTIIENGIVREDMSEENAEDVAYAQLKVHLVGIIEAYKQKATEEELQNKRINYEEKTQIIDAYNQLREQDKIPYTSLINKIKQGGIPKITVIAPTLEFEKGTPIDVYTFIKAVDNEDGEIVIDKTSTVVKTNLKNDEAGSYFVTYEVSDSDNNVATKTIEITIIADEEDVEIPEKPEIPEEGEEEEKPNPIPPIEGEEEEEEEDKPKPPETEDGEQEPDLPTDGEEEIIPPEEEDKEDEETTPPTTEPDDEETETPPEVDDGDKEEDEILPPGGDDNTPPETDDDKEEVLPPQVNEENKEEVILPDGDKNTGNANNSSSGNQNHNIVKPLNNNSQENTEEDLENIENTAESASLDETENMNEEIKEEEFIETIQGTYEDEFVENVEDTNFNEIAQEDNHIIIKVFVTITIIAGVTFVLVRKKLKANKRD